MCLAKNRLLVAFALALALLTLAGSGLVAAQPQPPSKVVVIDPGHGGSESGGAHYNVKTKKYDLLEKDVNLRVAQRLAARLQAAGYAVTIVEKREQVGGRAYQLREAGYTFDMGPSVVTLPSLFYELFAAAGRNFDDYVKLAPLHPYYRVYFPDDGYNAYLDYSGDAEEMKRELAKFDPRDAEMYEPFLAAIDPIFRIGYLKYGRTPFLRLGDFLKIAPQMLRLNATQSIYRIMGNKFHHEYNRRAMGFQSLFLGGNPLGVPAIYAMLPAIERHEGIWFAMGGMYSIVQAMAALFTELGGTLLTGCEAQEIIIANRRATGVLIADHQTLPADIVVSNGDTSWTYKYLIKPEHRRFWSDRKIERMKRGMSLFLLYLGTDQQYPKLLHHTLIFGSNYRQTLQQIFYQHRIPEQYSIYAHAPTRTDPSMAPPGGESMYFLLPVPTLDGTIDWAETGPRLTKSVIDFLADDFGLTDLREHIVVQRTFLPTDFVSELDSYKGAAFSFEPTLTQSAYFRPHNRSEDFDNLYIVGGGTHPGAGVPGVLLTAEIAARLIIGRLKG